MKTQRILLCGLPVAALALMLAAPLWAQGNDMNGPPPPPPGGPGGPGGPPGFAPRPDQWDGDQNGVVTEAEFSAAWKKSLDEHFARMDANGDGVLDKEEMAKRPAPPEGGNRPGRRDGMGQGRRGPGGPGGEAGPPAGGNRPGRRDRMGQGRRGPGGPGGEAGPPPEGNGPRGSRPGFPGPEELDADKDGNITRSEFDLTWDKSLKEHFKRLDANADGSLASDEMPRGPGPGQGPGGGRQGGRRGGPGGGPRR